MYLTAFSHVDSFDWSLKNWKLKKNFNPVQNSVQILTEDTNKTCWIRSRGQSKQPNSWVRGQWHRVLWRLSVSDLFICAMTTNGKEQEMKLINTNCWQKYMSLCLYAHKWVHCYIRGSLTTNMVYQQKYQGMLGTW